MIGIAIAIKEYVSGSGAVPPSVDNILLEDSSNILLEDGSLILLQ